MKILIKNGRLINPRMQQDEKIDIYIENGRIALMGKNISYVNTFEIDAEGMIVAPGLVDTHAHFRDPGYTHKEDILSGAQAAARGGYTTVLLMANTDPPVDNVETLKYVIGEGNKTYINIISCANVTSKMEGKELVDMAALAEAGAIAFSDDGRAITDRELAKEAMKMASAVDRPICLHEENPYFIRIDGINKGYASETLKVGGSSRKAEYTMIRHDLKNALHTGATVVIQHVSTKEGVELIREAKQYNPLIVAEVTPHHFSLTEEALIRKGSLAKVNPPLRTEEDRQALIEGLKDGTIDLIATDHAPHTLADKNGRIGAVPSGMIGLETALSLGIRELVEPGHLSMYELIDKMSATPARIYNLNAGYITLGSRADLVIFDPQETWTLGPLMSRSNNTPFIGEMMPGLIHFTISSGSIVFDNEAWYRKLNFLAPVYRGPGSPFNKNNVAVKNEIYYGDLDLLFPEDK